MVSDPSLFIHAQSGENAELEVHWTGKIDPSHGKFRLRVCHRCQERRVEIRRHRNLSQVFIGLRERLRGLSFMKKGKKQDVERVFDDSAVMAI